MSRFTEYNAYKKLEKLAAKAPNLSESGYITPARIKSHVIETDAPEEQKLRLCYATERVDGSILQALSQLSQEAEVIEKIKEMQSGDKVNLIHGFESENRSVLHTATRTFPDEKPLSSAAKNASDAAFAELEKLKQFLSDHGDQFTDVIQVGIGGSDLGPRAIYYALKKYSKEGKRVHFVSNVDPDDAANIVDGLDLTKTLVVVVSKSGSTMETLANEELIKKKFLDKNIAPQGHFVAITGKGSPMDNPDKYLASFYIWDYVGGRYSSTSMVGAFTLGFALGMGQLIEFLRGAHAMDQNALNPKPEENLSLFSALIGIWNRNFLNYPTLAIIPYSQPLHRFAAHLQQLDMESNGKSTDKEGNALDHETGPVIWGEPGTNSQHSFFQSIHQGTSIVPIEFIGFKNSQYNLDKEVAGTSSQEKLLSNLFAQSLALATGQKDKENPNKNFNGNRPNSVLFADKLTPYTMGAILAYYENKVAFQGFIWGINSFDQEGVQLGKRLANKTLDCFAAKKDPTVKSSFLLGKAYLETTKCL